MSKDDTSERSPFNRWWFIAAAFVVAIAIALGLILSGAVGTGPGSGDGSDSNATGVSPDPSSTAPGEQPLEASTCNLPDGSSSIPTTGPAATWNTDVYFKYPTSSDYGPVDNPQSQDWGCFAHSPTGALFAAANFFRGTAGPNYEALAVSASIDNAARTQWLSTQTGIKHQQTAGRVAQIAGFQFASAQDDDVIVNLGLQQSDVQGAIKIALNWDTSSRNWKVDFAASNLVPVQANVTQFTSWTAANG
ncbi:hypothetical protein [Clavibacter michiganensis]|uniref:hypothetical protein n=1 Tax=Clavibacter michiganensis TaxID=28447 RepID=UPI0011B0E802|nr:hypothetical protein [Clavibacter michiganensis]